MARAATTSDIYNAIAEPQRRAILELLAAGEYSVNDVAKALSLKQPQVSKHLRVLKEVGLVELREEGRSRMYSLNGAGLQPMQSWVANLLDTWNQRFNRLDDLLQELQQQEKDQGTQE